MYIYIYISVRTYTHYYDSFNVFHGDFNCPEKELIRYTRIKGVAVVDLYDFPFKEFE